MLTKVLLSRASVYKSLFPVTFVHNKHFDIDLKPNKTSFGLLPTSVLWHLELREKVYGFDKKCESGWMFASGVSVVCIISRSRSFTLWKKKREVGGAKEFLVKQKKKQQRLLHSPITNSVSFSIWLPSTVDWLDMQFIICPKTSYKTVVIHNNCQFQHKETECYNDSCKQTVHEFQGRNSKAWLFRRVRYTSVIW